MKSHAASAPAWLAPRPPRAQSAPLSPWVHVPLGELFVAAGNRLYARANGRQETGHEPLHASKSGRCVEINPARGLWWCRGCRRGGDAVRLMMTLHGESYRAATAWLVRRYGPPVDTRQPRRPVVEG